jgi:hypothetical protein
MLDNKKNLTVPSIKGKYPKTQTTHSWMKKTIIEISARQTGKFFGRLHRYIMSPEWLIRIRYKAIAAEYCKDVVLTGTKNKSHMRLYRLFQ